ncbi:MAG: PAS domain S-box protein [Deltaproteobacteria bacterium]|nr:PAS domain S-box protein [Deltaproteobacteria bacterium]
MKPRIKVLIADDSEDDAALIMREMARAFDATHTRVDTEAGLSAALSDAWDIIITDYAMPRLNGIEAIKLIRGSHIETPVIIVSGVLGEDRAVQAIKSGANDYILKDNLKRLVPTVERELKEHEMRLARMAAEDALHVSEERFRNLMESVPIGIAVLDKNHIVLDANASLIAMLGCGSKPELMNSSLLAHYLSDDDRERFKAAMTRLSVLGFETRLKSRDKAVFWAHITTAVHDTDAYIIAIIQDITARKNAEAALLESEERFRQIFEQNADAQILLEPNGGVVDVNHSTTTLYGYSRREIMASGAALLIPGDECAEFRIRIRTLEIGKTFNMERVDSSKKDGAKIVISIAGQRIQLKRQGVIYCTVRDISEKIRLEEEAAVMQAKLIHANKMTALGTLASGIAHEINNPNNFILFNSELLVRIWKGAEGILNQYQQANGEFQLGGLAFSEARISVPSLLEGIGQGAHRVKRIVDELKDFARDDRSDLDDPLDVNKAVLSSVAILKREIEQHTDNFHVALGEGLPSGRGSGQRIEQVLINLIMNALDALQGRDKGVTVRTSLYEGEGGAQILVRVTDEGQGIPADLLPRITEPFFTTKSGAGGTGLGLSISYSIIKEHGGTIEFDSKEGAGTTVTMRLPVRLPPPEYRCPVAD